MATRFPAMLRQRLFSSSSRARAAVPAEMATFNAEASQLRSSTTSTVPKLGRIGRWYLPTMALIAAGMLYTRKSIHPFSARTGQPLPLDAANRHIGFAIENHLETHNTKATSSGGFALTQEERNAMLMEAYGERNSLEDMERALAGHGAGKHVGPQQRLVKLDEAYGARTSLKDMERAMAIYEVQ